MTSSGGNSYLNVSPNMKWAKKFKSVASFVLTSTSDILQIIVRTSGLDAARKPNTFTVTGNFDLMASNRSISALLFSMYSIAVSLLTAGNVVILHPFINVTNKTLTRQP